LFNSKLNGRKVEFNTPLNKRSTYELNGIFQQRWAWYRTL